MVKLDKPNFDFSSIFDFCINSFKNSNIKTLVINNKSVFMDSYDNYLNFGERDLLFAFPDRTGQITTVKDEITFIKNLYEKFKTGVNTIEVYEKIRVSTGHCAYCNQGIVYPLDHYLPKSKFPLLSINFLNLIPCCSDCNFTLNRLSTKPHPQIIHPYFDHDSVIYNWNWIFGSVPDNQEFYVNRKAKVVVEFYTDFSNMNISKSLEHRLNFQFENLIKPQYKKQAPQLISGEINQLLKIRKIGTPNLIKYCEDRIDNYPVNSYLRAVYYAFANSPKLMNHIVNYPLYTI